MTHLEQIDSIARDERLSQEEALSALDLLGVRGAFYPNGDFIGYDYRDQKWLEIADCGEPVA